MLQQGQRGPRRLEIKRNRRWAGPLIESPGQSFRDCSVNDYIGINKDGSFATWDVNIRGFLCIWCTHSVSFTQPHTRLASKEADLRSLCLGVCC